MYDESRHRHESWLLYNQGVIIRSHYVFSELRTSRACCADKLSVSFSETNAVRLSEKLVSNMERSRHQVTPCKLASKQVWQSFYLTTIEIMDGRKPTANNLLMGQGAFVSLISLVFCTPK